MEKKLENLFISRDVVWKMEESFLYNGAESPIFFLYRILWKITVKKKSYHDCAFQIHLQVVDAPTNYSDVNFSVRCHWMHYEDQIPPKDRTYFIVSDLISGKSRKICESSSSELQNRFYERMRNSSYGFSIDHLSFICSITPSVDDHVSLGLQEEQFPTLSFNCAESLAQDFEKALYNPEHTDIILKCGDKIIPAHKIILACRSEVFQAMFRNDLKESQEGVVNIKDIEPSVFEQLLHYIYSGECIGKTVESMCNIYKAAHKYNIEPLKERCILFIKENLETRQACEVLLLADLYPESDLKIFVISYIIHRKEFLLSKEWFEFAKDYPNLAQEVFLFYVQKAEIKETVKTEEHSH